MSFRFDSGECARRRNKLRPTSLSLLLGGAVLGLSAGHALAIDDPSKPLTATAQTSEQQASTEQLLKRLQTMEQRIQMLEGQLKQKQAGTAAATNSAPVTGRAPAAGTSAAAATPGAPGVPDANAPAGAPADAGKKVAGAPQTPAEGRDPRRRHKARSGICPRCPAMRPG